MRQELGGQRGAVGRPDRFSSGRGFHCFVVYNRWSEAQKRAARGAGSREGEVKKHYHQVISHFLHVIEAHPGSIRISKETHSECATLSEVTAEGIFQWSEWAEPGLTCYRDGASPPPQDQTPQGKSCAHCRRE